MQEFIQSAAKQLGIEESVASQATSTVLGFLKEKLTRGEFGELAAQVPGLSDLAGADASDEESGGSMLGSMMKAASSALGGDAGDALALTGKLKDSGLDVDKLAPFLGRLIEYVKDNAGEETINAILDKLPQLKSLLP